ncbi:MAG: polysaccharide biosynthesis protein [Gammaproteobacteria bacterium]|nr:polysaccharide biosynthesis protein [Gammaproteobacteria bacterium]
MFKSKTLLIAGGTGSFGTAIIKRLLTTEVDEVRIFSRDEKKQHDMRLALNNSRIKFFIGDVRDRDSVAEAMRGVDYVFHAAALKQVPSCEFHPLQAIKTNTLGAGNVMDMAIAEGVERAIFLSTDKAVNPINTMGMSKSLMEKLMLAKSRMQTPNDAILCATRYGNVMASRGSVIPLFVEQLKAGKPLTVTDANMTRFLMSLEDSVDLVLYALDKATSGDILIQKAPAATIGILVQALQELFDRDNEVHIIGTRHGEKLHETLVSREEISRAEDLGRFFRIPIDNRDLNYTPFTTSGDEKISQLDEYNSHNTKQLDVAEVKQLLLKLDYIQEQLND